MFTFVEVMSATLLTKLTPTIGLKYLKNKYSCPRESRKLCTVAESSIELKILKEVFVNEIKMQLSR